MKKYLKLIPIEIYALTAPSVLMLVGFSIWALNSTKLVGFITLVKKLNYLLLLGNADLNGIFIIFWLLVSICTVIYPVVSFKKLAVRNSPIIPAIKSLAAINVFATVTAFVLGLSLTSVFYFVSGGRVLESTLAVDQLERTIFGGLPTIPLINYFSGTMVESIILYTYFYLISTFSLVVVLAFLDKTSFRQTLIAFFLSCLISIPIFAAIPIISPDGLYIAKVFKAEVASVPVLDNIAESELFSSFNAFFHKVWISDDNSFYSVSSFPSLHAAWGVLAVLGIFKARKKLLSLILAIWLVFNSVGTFYSLQHYALDTVAGLLFGLLMFYLAGKLMDLETKYYIGQDWYRFIDFLINLKNQGVKKLLRLSPHAENIL